MSIRVLPKVPLVLVSVCGLAGVYAAFAQDEKPSLVPPELFHVPEGMEITVWATTPMLYNPTNIDFDRWGRLWVAEGANYRTHENRRPEGDRVIVLSDTTGQGKADKCEVFMQGRNLVAPMGVAVLDDKVVISQPPDLLVCDLDADGKIDPAGPKNRKALLTGFRGRSHDHSLHSTTAGPDGYWYFNQGNQGADFKDASGKAFHMLTESPGRKSDDGHVWVGGFTVRMKPDGTDASIVGHGYRNSYEQIVTSFGHVFQNDNDDPPACRVTHVLEGGNAGYYSRDGKRFWSADHRPWQQMPLAEWRQEDPGVMPAGDIYGGGAPTGIAMYENGALGKEWEGMLLSCDSGRNVVFGYKPSAQGAGFGLERFNFLTTNKTTKFYGSDFMGGKPSEELFTYFRPSDVTVGPDGAIYVADWFDPRVGGHADLDSMAAGTIYRIAPKGFKSVVPKMDLNTTEGQIEALKSPAVNVRHNGFVRLKAQGAKAVPAVEALLSDSNPYIAARAIWLLAQMDAAGSAKVQALTHSPSDTVRLVAYRALRRAGGDVPALAAQMAADSSAAIRAEGAVFLRDVSAEKSLDTLLKVAAGYDGKDRSYLESFGMGCEGKEAAVYAALRPKQPADSAEWSQAFADIAWRLGAEESISDLLARARSPKSSKEEVRRMLTAIAFIRSEKALDAMASVAADKQFAQNEDAHWLLRNRQSGEWSGLGVAAVLAKYGLVEAPAKLVRVDSTPPTSGTPKLPSEKEIAALTGDVEKGRAAVAVCYSCHKIGSQGAEFAPDLTAFGKLQPKEVIIHAIAQPSAEISHGYEGVRLATKDGVFIDGIVIADGDPLEIKSIGALVQRVPRSKLNSITPLQHSLMPEPGAIGLTGQSVADIVAYLQSDSIR